MLLEDIGFGYVDARIVWDVGDRMFSGGEMG